jgi:hypothetical protein
VFACLIFPADSLLPLLSLSFSLSLSLYLSMYLRFACDEAGCVFEYRVWDVYNYRELRPWTPVVHKTDISWLNWRQGGPGNGKYRLYVRAVDPAGNKDSVFYSGANVYDWNYVSPTPWDIILGTLFGFFFLLLVGYLEYKRRQRKAAMER